MGRRLFVPEVLQSSASDCGPACIRALVGGFGPQLDYAALRAACKTDVDGTSIDRIEDVLLDLGVDAEQTILPRDLVVCGAGPHPAIAVTCPDGFALHFVVLWRRHRGLMQLMDPGQGRRFTRPSRLVDELFEHTHVATESDLAAWIRDDSFVAPLRARLAELGMRPAEVDRLATAAHRDPSGRDLAVLDAAARFAGFLISCGAAPRGVSPAEHVRRLWFLSLSDFGAERPRIPRRFWSAWPLGDDRVALRGAVLVRVRSVPKELSHADVAQTRARHPPVYRWLAAMAWQGGGALLLAAVALLVLASVGTLLEALVLRGLLDISQELGTGLHRAVALAMAAVFALALFGVQVPAAQAILSLGRRVETGVRIAVLEALPRLPTAYFATRPSSDLGHRLFALHELRHLPNVVAVCISRLSALLATSVAVVWLAPAAGAWVAALVAVAVGGSLLAARLLQDRDLRVRTLSGSLAATYGEVQRGIVAARAHDATGALEVEHDGLLGDWVAANRALLRGTVAMQSAVGIVSMALAVWLVLRWITSVQDLGDTLLLVYWTISLPLLGAELVDAASHLPAFRSLGLRALEPVQQSAPASAAATHRRTATRPYAITTGAAIVFDQVHVAAGDRVIVGPVDLELRAREHVAIVGTSGAGKSTLLGLLLGWHHPAQGQVRVDGEVLDASTCNDLRRQTAWVDADVGLFDTTLVENICYGRPDASPVEVARVVEVAGLAPTVGRLPFGLQTRVGAGGSALSAGEAQRVRLARALLRAGARLVLLDEAMRGLDRDMRHALLARARGWWRDATLLCATHDIDAALDFDRVLVVDHGRVIEDANPRVLAQNPQSTFGRLLMAERKHRRQGLGGIQWHRLALRRGRLEDA